MSCPHRKLPPRRQLRRRRQRNTGPQFLPRQARVCQRHGRGRQERQRHQKFTLPRLVLGELPFTAD